MTLRFTLICLGISGVLGAAVSAPAIADVGVTGLSPNAGRPGAHVVVRIGCGSCDAGIRFPISLVPVSRAPKPYPCRGNGLCAPSSSAPPRLHPFAFLGHTEPGRLLSDNRPPGTESRLRFQVPEVRPGLYAFVIFCADCVSGPRGSLIVDTATRLRVRPDVS